jgi:competence protein ComEA
MGRMVSVTLTRSRALMAALIVLVVLAVAGRRLAGAGAASQSTPAGSIRAIRSSPAVAPKLVVHVVGAVRRPGLYRLKDGSRVADAVARAGGAASRADLAAVNLAAPLADGSQIVVPRVAGGAAGVPVEPAGSAAAAKVSLASATLEQLDALPGVGPVTAQRILDHRASHGPFRSVDDLDAVPGIGPARVEQLRDLVTP